MSIAHLTSEQLEKLVHLFKEKDSLEARLHEVTQAIYAFEKTGGTSRNGARKFKGTGRRGRVSNLKEQIFALLKPAGAEGLTVTEMAAKLNLDKRNVFSWFYTTGKKASEIKQVGSARYALIS